jgi:hypothetical protein
MGSITRNKGDRIMANPFEMFETDDKLEIEGIVLDYGDFRYKVARAGGANKKFINMMNAKLLKPYQKQIESGTMDDEVAGRLIREIYAATIILDADVLIKSDKKKKKDTPPEYKQGLIMDKNGTIAPFTRENVVRHFTLLPVLFQAVKKDAEDFALFKTMEQEEDVKN